MIRRQAAEPAAEKKILIVPGCLSERYGSELFDEMPEVDIFLGVNDYEKLPQIVQEFQTGAKANRCLAASQKNSMEFSERKTEAMTRTLRRLQDRRGMQ